MINFNGRLKPDNELLFNSTNRAFKYGDALFETLKVVNGKILYTESHYFRLMASMRMLRMEISMGLTLEFFESEVLKTVEANELIDARVRLTVYRKDGGLYTPNSNKVNYSIEAKELKVEIKQTYEVELYKDFYLNSGLLSTLKTTNKITNVLASIFASENNYNNCILLNEKKNVVEAINGNIFIISNGVIKTPPISDGCVKGIVRSKLLDYFDRTKEYTCEEISISPFDIQKAEEVFVTNVIVGIQPVTNYRKKVFKTEISEGIINKVLPNLV
ncbi:aminotransferase class IV [Lutibacter sp. TH_r2]|uniref:aminotransferase class IV n=1 Tax=Lutibacter sp. TH_r2 TaxID=3082083 RepID=UPI002953AE6F|nr:aminotransferase class IV [Lutibacter sp. TH_r2]MDV7188440.1 aminotransferase class IV [Lutibacter sp. TH_r2]